MLYLHCCHVRLSCYDQEVDGVVVVVDESAVDTLLQGYHTTLHVLRAIVVTSSIGIATISSTYLFIQPALLMLSFANRNIVCSSAKKYEH